MYAQIKAAVARAEIERKSARQKSAAIQRYTRGDVPGGIRLTGYEADGTLVPGEARIVKAFFERFLAGDSIRGSRRG